MITLASSCGFCPGVRRAAQAVEDLIREEGPSSVICLLGELIHNEDYNASLCRRGVKIVTVEGLKDVLASETKKKVYAVIRTHGIEVSVEEELDRLKTEHPNLTVKDMTCPSVKRIHAIADEKTNENTCFILFCTPGHPEALGIMSHAKGEKYAVSPNTDITEIKIVDKLPIICSQTTQNIEQFVNFKKSFRNLYTNAIFFDTICNVTESRQKEAERLSKCNDAMIVIGGKQSSNCKKLYDVCRSNCENTFFVERVADLPKDIRNFKNIGITAGASTPAEIITEVYNHMSEINFEELLEESLTTLHTGETVTGTVVDVTANEIYLDLGAKFTGVIVKEQITEDPAAKLPEMFKVGDEVTAFVIRVEDGKGIATLSKLRVDRDNNWVILKNAFENGDVLEGNIASADKGGCVMNIEGNRVFIPASQTGIARGGDLSVLVGTKQKIKVIEYDETKKRAIGSIKVILAEEKKAREDAIYATLEVGKHYMGTVMNLTNYGAFVDIGGVDGMVHTSELSWKRIKHPSQVVSVGQQIDVFIKDIDLEKKRISLGYKTQENDTWFQFTQKFAVGDIVPAKITSLAAFGAFAEVYEDVEGLIHISRISTEHVNNPADVLSVGQEVNVKITEIDDENRKLSLSIRAIEEAAQRAAAAEARAAEKAERDAQRAAEKAARDAEREEAARKEAEERADMAPYIVGTI